jgi:hypothetical protein
MTGQSLPGFLFEQRMTNQNIPKTFLSITNLGKPLDYFQVRRINRVGSLVLLILFLTGAALITLSAMAEALQAIRLHGPAMLDDKLAAPMGYAFIFFLAGLLAGWSAFTHWNMGVVTYEGGFAWCDRKGIQVWRWEELVSITSAITRVYTIGIYTGTTHIYTLSNCRSQRLVLSDSLRRVEQLAMNIERNTFPLLYAPAVDRYKAGKRLGFGPLLLSTEGIEIGKNTYPWQMLKEVSIHHGRLKVFGKEKGLIDGASLSVSTIPNVRVLLAIIHQVAGLKVDLKSG